MRSLIQLLRIAVQLSVLLFIACALFTHFKPQYTDAHDHDRIRSPANRQPTRQSSPDVHSNSWIFNLLGNDKAAATEKTHERLHEPYNTTIFKTTEYVSPDDSIRHFVLDRKSSVETQDPPASVLFLTITKDAKSWGRNPTEPPRTIYSFLDFITNTTLAGPAASVGILTSSESEYDLYKRILTPSGDPSAGYYDYPFQRITLVYHVAPTRDSPAATTVPSSSEPGASSSADPNHPSKESSGDRKERHAIAQHERRAALAKLRNYLQSVSLRHETHLLWLDSDVYKFSSVSMVEAMTDLTSTTAENEVGILTARCRMGEPEKANAWLDEHPDFKLPPPAKDDEPEPEGRGAEGGRYEVIAWGAHSAGQYDLNAWRGRRTGPNNAEQERLWTDLTSWEPHPFPDGKTAILDRVVDSEGAGPTDVVRLDSVGGTILMIRADLVRMGLNFAAGYYVGMSFEHGEGYDGIETEGLCLLSRSFSRDGQSMCYSMGNPWSVWHTVF